MREKKDRNAEIVTPERPLDYVDVHDGMVRIGYMFETMRPLTPEDVGRLCERGFTPNGRFTILSQLLFPQLCSIIGRGLTLEEMGLLSGLDAARRKRALVRLAKMGLPSIETMKADGEMFVKVMVPLRIDILTDEGAEETISKEPVLAPKESVQNIIRRGYVTRDGRSLRYDYLTFVPGPMPTVYIFKSGKDLSKGLVGEANLSNFEARSIEDRGAMKVSHEIAIAELKMLKKIFESEHAVAFIERIMELFFSIGESVHHFACRYRALNDLETYNTIERLSESYLSFAQSLGDRYLNDKSELCKKVGILIGETIEKLNEEMDE